MSYTIPRYSVYYKLIKILKNLNNTGYRPPSYSWKKTVSISACSTFI